MQVVCRYLEDTRADLVSVIEDKGLPKNERMARAISVAFRVAGCVFACLTAADFVTRVCTFTLTSLPVLGIMAGAVVTHDCVRIGINIKNMLPMADEMRPNERFSVAIRGTLLVEPGVKLGQYLFK